MARRTRDGHAMSSTDLMGSLALISQLLASHISNSDALLVDSFSMLVDTLSYAPLL